MKKPAILLLLALTINACQQQNTSNTAATENAVDVTGNIKLALAVLVVIIIALGVYPQPMMDLTKDAVGAAMAGK